MKLRFTGRLLFLNAVVIASAAAQEPVKPGLTPTIITATRQVTLFTGLEKQVLQAVQQRDKAGLQAIVSDDFEVVMPNTDPLAGDDWVDSVLAKNFALKAFSIRQVSVADLGDAAVVKFLREQHATYRGKDESGEFFVVDLWKKSRDGWKLANRYVARVGAAPASRPPRPTGKE